MINIISKFDCCGCGACIQACPKHCISFNEDEQGFFYPLVDIGLCVDCHLCEKVCPTLNQASPRGPLEVYAAKNPNEIIRLASSSGGIFTMLAEVVISRGGVVFGARFNEEWEVVHDYTETIEGLSVFRGSKYVQSRIGSCFQQAKEFLLSGREVLFSGTPCQIAGLKLFLRKDYENLLTVDIVCHGVPSPKIWRDYLKYIMRPKGAAGKNTVLSSLNEAPVLTGISFRDKSTGWKKYGFSVRMKSAFKADENSVFGPLNPINEEIILHETLDINIYMQGFLKNLYLRPSCYACDVKCGRSHSDLTIADFWGIDRFFPGYDDDKGVSLVLVNSSKGMSYFSSLAVNKTSVAYELALAGNPSLEHSVAIPKLYEQFWSIYGTEGIPSISLICSRLRPSRIKYITIYVVRKILGKRVIKLLKSIKNKMI